MLPICDLWAAFCVLLSFGFFGKKINNVVFRQMRCSRCSFRVRCRHRSTPDLSLDGETVDSELVVIRNESEIFNVGMSKLPKVASRPAGDRRGAVRAPAGYGTAPRSNKYVSKMKKKYYLKFKRYVDHQVLRSTNVFRYTQTVDGRFSDSSGVLMKYCIQPVDPRVLYNN